MKSALKESKETKPSRRPGRAQKRRQRARPMPKWLLKPQDLDEIARRRLLMVLSVLSGEKPVTEVISEAELSRGTYYQLEEKALRAMLVALSPASGPEGTEASALESAKSRIGELEERIKRLERDKRRAERLLYVTRKVVKPGPVTTYDGRGRRRGVKRASTRSGSEPSQISTTTPTEAATGTARETRSAGAASGATP